MFNFLRRRVVIPPAGCIPEPFDKQDFQLEEVCEALPAFDWEKGFDIEAKLNLKIPIKSQGRSSSCVGQAWAYYCGVLEALEIKKYRDCSARWFYSQIYLPQGGAYLRDGGQITVKQGAVPSYYVPDYKTEDEMRKKDWAIDVPQVAKLYLKDSYVSIPKRSIDQIASIMLEHNGFISGVRTNFKNWKVTFPKISSVQPQGGHAIYFGKVKLINNKKYLGFPNSWGEAIGDKGWQWLGEEWVNSGRFFNPKVIRDLPSEIQRKEMQSEKPKHKFTKDLKYGMRNTEVIWLQRCLAYEECFDYPAFTGNFFGYTLRAVKKFQEKYRNEILKPLNLVEPTGFVGSSTRKKLNQLFS